MFGYIVANFDKLSPEDRTLYRACYCGLCRALGAGHGARSRLTLSYDMSFIILLLSGIYDLPFEKSEIRCGMHPMKRHMCARNEMSDYAADINVALAYYKALDDWRDDHDVTRLCASRALRRSCQRVERKWPRVCEAITKGLQEISAMEDADVTNPDLPARAFGRMMGEIATHREDEHASALRAFGARLGEFIYVMDAVMDLKSDIRRERYNPLVTLSGVDFRAILDALMADCVEAYHALPPSPYAGILENILYSGVWSRYEAEKVRQQKRKQKEAEK